METPDKYKSASYWTQLIQLMIYNNIRMFLDENNLSQKEFAERLGLSKGYVSQILNGDFDHRLTKLVELALACNLVPSLELVPARYAEKVVSDTYLKPIDWKSYVHFDMNSILPIITRPAKIKSPDRSSTKVVRSITNIDHSGYYLSDDFNKSA